MEFIYNLLIFLLIVVIIAAPIILIKPKLLSKLLGSKATRKNILIYSVVLILGLVIIAGLSEPESVKQARLEKEQVAQLERQQEQEQAQEKAKQLEQQQAAQEEQQEQEHGETEPEAPPHNPEDYWHEVTTVVDGDTVKASIDGQVQSIRIIGIDAPESTNKNECYGQQSSDKAKEFLSGKWIMFRTDSTQDKYDKYDRLLAYIYFDEGTDFGKRMIEEGYAFEYTYDKPYQHQKDYKAMEEYSMAKSHGLWAKDTCDGKRTKPAPQTSTTTPSTTQNSSPQQQPSSNCDPNYTPCVPNVSYDLNCPDIGFQVRVIGTDRHRFDRDGDGYGCESY